MSFKLLFFFVIVVGCEWVSFEFFYLQMETKWNSSVVLFLPHIVITLKRLGQCKETNVIEALLNNVVCSAVERAMLIKYQPNKCKPPIAWTANWNEWNFFVDVNGEYENMLINHIKWILFLQLNVNKKRHNLNIDAMINHRQHAEFSIRCQQMWPHCMDMFPMNEHQHQAVLQRPINLQPFLGIEWHIPKTVEHIERACNSPIPNQHLRILNFEHPYGDRQQAVQLMPSLQSECENEDVLGFNLILANVLNSKWNSYFYSQYSMD